MVVVRGNGVSEDSATFVYYASSVVEPILPYHGVLAKDTAVNNLAMFFLTPFSPLQHKSDCS